MKECKECRHIKGLNIECTVCHVTGNIYSLVQSSSQTPKTIALDVKPVGFELLFEFLFRAKIYMYVYFGWCLQAKALNSKALNYIPTSLSCAKFLILEKNNLNLALIHTYGDIPFKILKN